jgi:hypothetical protein
VNLYILDGKVPIMVDDLSAWAKWFEAASRTVAKTVIDPNPTEPCAVSTVFLGLDHSWVGGAPLLFETLVFGGPRDGLMDRYATWDQAENGHDDIVAEVKASLSGENLLEFPKKVNRRGD